MASMLSCFNVMNPFRWMMRPEKSVLSGKICSLSPSLMGMLRRFMRAVSAIVTSKNSSRVAAWAKMSSTCFLTLRT